jgi:EAL domain-containing protein (putative c-di-GMP-specific phosphodiesterase class I)
MRLLRELRADGLVVAIDDFGAGHSSLAQLQRLPVDILKVDKQFLVGVPVSVRSAAMLRGIAELVAALDLQLVVEGIETEGQRAFLAGLPGALGQGFLLARPRPAADLAAVLAAGRLPGS